MTSTATAEVRTQASDSKGGSWGGGELPGAASCLRRASFTALGAESEKGGDGVEGGVGGGTAGGGDGGAACVLQQQQRSEAGGVAGVEKLASPPSGRGPELGYNRSRRCNTCNTCNDIDEPSTHADQPHDTQDSKDRDTWAPADIAHRIPHVSNASGLRARTRPGSGPSSRAQTTGYLATIDGKQAPLPPAGHGIPLMGAQPAEEEREREREVTASAEAVTVASFSYDTHVSSSSASAEAVTVETCHNTFLSEDASKHGVGARSIGCKEGLIGSFGKGGGRNESLGLAANGMHAAVGAEKNAVLPATGGMADDDDDWM